jgi:hypothetical protein
MGLLDWWRKRASVDPTAVGTAEDEVQIVRAPEAAAPAGLRDACAAHPEVEAAYLFEAQRGGASYLVLGVLLDEVVSDDRMAELVRGLERSAEPLRVGVEAIGGETLRDVRGRVEPLFERRSDLP